MKLARGQRDAFTLIEMMVVVAITAIMAAIAMPNYQKYMARSRQKQAQTALGVIYTSERTFFTDTGSYSYCVSKIGYNPAKDNAPRYYATGFLLNGTAFNTTCGPYSNISCGAYSYNYTGGSDQICATTDAWFVETAYVNSAAASFVFSNDLSTAGTELSLGRFTYTAHAIGNISNDALTDHWTIDDTKNLLNIRNGI